MMLPCTATRIAPLNWPRWYIVDISSSMFAISLAGAGWTTAHEIKRDETAAAIRSVFFKDV
jgi:hypothetical protein